MTEEVQCGFATRLIYSDRGTTVVRRCKRLEAGLPCPRAKELPRLEEYHPMYKEDSRKTYARVMMSTGQEELRIIASCIEAQKAAKKSKP